MYKEVLMPSLKNSSIYIHEIKDTPRDVFYGLHIHDECEMAWVIDGEICFFTGSDEYRLLPGDIIFVNSRVPHGTRAPCGMRQFLIEAGIEKRYAEQSKKMPSMLMSHFGKDVAVFRSGSEINGQISECFQNIIKENTERQKSYDTFIKAEMLKVFSILYRNNVATDPDKQIDSSSIRRITPVIDYVDAHYKESVSLADVSRLLNVNTAHFCRIFRSAVGTSFVQYLNLVRISAAEKLLFETEKTMAEIAVETGFSTAAYFAETFRAVMGCSPSLYKKIKNSDGAVQPITV